MNEDSPVSEASPEAPVSKKSPEELKKTLANIHKTLSCCQRCRLRFAFIDAESVYKASNTEISNKYFNGESDEEGTCPLCLGLLQTGEEKLGHLICGMIAPEQSEWSRTEAAKLGQRLNEGLRPGTEPFQPLVPEMILDSNLCTAEVMPVFPAAGYKDIANIRVGVVTSPSIKTRDRAARIAMQYTQIVPIISAKDAFRFRVVPLFQTILGVEVLHEAMMFAHVTLNGEADESDPVLKPLERPRKRDFSGRKRVDQQHSLTVVDGLLDSMTNEDFEKMDFVPPPRPVVTPSMSLRFKRFGYFIGGRYCKFSRRMSNSFWSFYPDEAVLLMAISRSLESVETAIIDVMKKYIPSDEFKFSSSGREDVNVRMLGSGRPFAIEVVNGRFIPDKKLIEHIQSEINKSTSSLKISELCLPSRESMAILRAAASDKRKSYSCVVWSSEVISNEMAERIQDIPPFDVKQQTPGRVSHRRADLERPRTIYSLKCRRFAPNWMEVHLTTQGGTYIKEFVHGDDGRTKPCLAEVLHNISHGRDPGAPSDLPDFEEPLLLKAPKEPAKPEVDLEQQRISQERSGRKKRKMKKPIRVVCSHDRGLQLKGMEFQTLFRKETYNRPTCRIVQLDVTDVDVEFPRPEDKDNRPPSLLPMEKCHS